MKCPHYGLDEPSATFSADAPMRQSVPRLYVIRPDDCPKCAMERIKKLRPALQDAIGLACELLHGPTVQWPRSREIARKLEQLIDVLHEDITGWLHPLPGERVG